MAIIYSYPEKTSPAGGDFLVITDSEQPAPNKNRTKSLTIDNLASYVISSTSAITGSGTINTIPLFTAATILGDSILKQEAGTAYATTKNLIVDGNIYQSNMGESVSIGKGALISGTSGTVGENVAIGGDALAALTTGTNNVAIGADTIKSSTIGKNNIAIGKKALEVVTTDNNIALGFNALNLSLIHI